jgi:hypothetical protein
MRYVTVADMTCGSCGESFISCRAKYHRARGVTMELYIVLAFLRALVA